MVSAELRCVVCGDSATPRGTPCRCFICGALGCGRLGCGIAHYERVHEREGPRYLAPPKPRGKVRWKSQRPRKITGAR